MCSNMVKVNVKVHMPKHYEDICVFVLIGGSAAILIFPTTNSTSIDLPLYNMGMYGLPTQLRCAVIFI